MGVVSCIIFIAIILFVLGLIGQVIIRDLEGDKSDISITGIIVTGIIIFLIIGILTLTNII